MSPSSRAGTVPVDPPALVDTSVWIDHLRSANARLTRALESGEVWCHCFIVGELACGNLENRHEILDLLRALPAAEIAEHDEVMDFLDSHRLAGRGIGWIDAHLLASARLTRLPLWTLDKNLAAIAEELELTP